MLWGFDDFNSFIARLMTFSMLSPRLRTRGLTNQPCPVARLPVELLVEIFLFVVSPSVEAKYAPPTFYAPHTPSYLSCASPFSLSHVCRSWRAISLSLPRLWTSLHVVYPKNPKILPLLSLWVQRSRSHHLNLSLRQLHGHGQALLSLDDSARNFELEFEATRQVWQLFLTVIDRWLYLDVNVCMDFKSLLSKISESVLQGDRSAPLPLEAVKVIFGSCESGLYGKNGEAATSESIKLRNNSIFSDESTFFSYLLRSSPHLRKVEWDNRYVPIQFDLVTEWPASLTDITLYGSQDVISILSDLGTTCKSLRKLTIYEQTSSPHLANHANHHSTPGIASDSRKLSRLVFPNLEILKLGSFPHPEILFGHLIVPSLHTLTILRGYNNRRGWRGLTRTAWFALSEMLARSHLKNLSILEIGGVALDLAGEFDGPVSR